MLGQVVLISFKRSSPCSANCATVSFFQFGGERSLSYATSVSLYCSRQGRNNVKIAFVKHELSRDLSQDIKAKAQREIISITRAWTGAKSPPLWASHA
jgi:hypothetical protein